MLVWNTPKRWELLNALIVRLNLSWNLIQMNNGMIGINVSLATFIHNTSYHSAIGCSPTILFGGREPIKPLDLRFNYTIFT